MTEPGSNGQQLGSDSAGSSFARVVQSMFTKGQATETEKLPLTRRVRTGKEARS